MIITDELVEKAARQIMPSWWCDPEWKIPDGEHPLNNYPQQHLGYQSDARKWARAVLIAVLPDIERAIRGEGQS